MPSESNRSSPSLPNARSIRRACAKELYRTNKKLGVYIPKDKQEAGLKLYTDQVMQHLAWVVEHRNERRKLADWWAEAVAPELARCWDVNETRLVEAFREAFGG
ncbi:dehydrogenase [Marinicrinis sediminis]|uniref:Dehydrogenase n=1 Tax=Marinicrinis sediminis TaxID=1652465 RepID=A0ABW5RD72_9BACL